MRLWSLHPKYLDAKGLVALWRETLLAKNVLQGKTKGYTHHPQLRRFKNSVDGLQSINQYLAGIYEEAKKRGYSFDHNKIEWNFTPVQIPVNHGQVVYESLHLLKKLKTRDEALYKKINKIDKFITHPIFMIVEGGIEEWEIVTA